MATIQAILNTKYQSKDGSYPIVIRVIDGKKQRLQPIGYKVKERYFEAGQVKQAHPEADIINAVIDEEVLKAKRYYADCKIKGVPADISLVFSAVKSHSFTDYLRHRQKQHKEADQPDMEDKCRRYAKEFTLCFGKDVYFNEITQDFLRTYDIWLKTPIEGVKKANSANTRAKKFEFLSKYYTNAVNEGKAHLPNPFKLYKIPTTPVKKEKMSREEYLRIKGLELAPGPVKLARDLFLFSYYCKGIRFENCIKMPKSAIINGRLHYTINKGNKHLSTLIHPKLQALIDTYINNDTDTIFGRMQSTSIPTKRRKKNVVGSENTYINTNLKIVGQLAEIPFELCFHHARHAYAYHMKKNNKSIEIIKDSLGHSRSSITENYIKAFDAEYLDEESKELYQ